MGLRRQLPVYSPVRLRSVFAGTLGALGAGDPVGVLSARLASHFAARDHILLDSGTSALRLAIEGALKARGSDTVALPAYCCYDVATAAVGAGARIRLYDVDPATLGPDWDSLAGVLSVGVSAVVVVHLYGAPVDIARVTRMATTSRAVVIEDAAQGIGGSIDGRPLGSIGSVGILSFGRGKGLTGGGGGALLANDEVGLAVLDDVRDRPAEPRSGWGGLLRLAAQWLFGRPSLYSIPASMPWLGLGETLYKDPWEPREIAPGLAAALLANWDASHVEAEVRKQNADELRRMMPEREPTAVQRGTSQVYSSNLRLPVLVPNEVRSATVAKTLTATGVVAGYPAPLGAVSQVQEALVDAGANPGAERLADDLMTIPVHSRSDLKQIWSVVETVGRLEPTGSESTWHGNGS